MYEKHPSQLDIFFIKKKKLHYLILYRTSTKGFLTTHASKYSFPLLFFFFFPGWGLPLGLGPVAEPPINRD